MNLLIIIPCYNEETNIINVYKDITKYLSHVDCLFINDCSSDNTKEVLQKLDCNYINVPVNLGLSGVMQLGYKYAYDNGYDAAIQFDGDGQHQAKYVELMLEQINDGVDIVIGSRFVNRKKAINMRMIGSRFFTLLIQLLTGKKIADPTSGMRMLNRKMLYDYAYHMNRKPEPDTLVYQIRNGAKLKEIEVEMNERVEGTSYLNGWNSAKYMIKTTISILFFMY